jgi:hypothetical protein
MVKCVRVLSLSRLRENPNITAVSSPYSYSCKRVPKDAEDQIEAGLGAARALMEVHGTEFMVSIMDGGPMLLGNLMIFSDGPTLQAAVPCTREHRGLDVFPWQGQVFICCTSTGHRYRAYFLIFAHTLC